MVDMVDSISSVNFYSLNYQNKPVEKKSSVARGLLVGGAVTTTAVAALQGTKLIYPIFHKFLRFGIPATALGIIGYGIYDAIKNKNNKPKDVKLGDKKDYAKAAIAGAGVAAAYLPINQAISGGLISLKFSKGFKNFFSSFKMLLPQMKNYLHGMYIKLLGKNFGANKTIFLGTLAVAGIGAAVGTAIQGLTDLISKRSNKK